MIVMNCWVGGTSQFIALPRSSRPYNFQEVADTVMMGSMQCGVGRASYEFIVQPTEQQIREGKETYEEMYGGA